MLTNLSDNSHLSVLTNDSNIDFSTLFFSPNDKYIYFNHGSPSKVVSINIGDGSFTIKNVFSSRVKSFDVQPKYPN